MARKGKKSNSLLIVPFFDAEMDCSTLPARQRKPFFSFLVFPDENIEYRLYVQE